MDHLPHPQDAAFPPVVVPYYDKFKFDGGSFTDYPIRCGFDKSEFKFGVFSGILSNDHDSFFQAWLFFGLLQEFFGANLQVDEFVDHQEQRLTTVRLPYWSAKWLRSLPIFSRSKRIAECERVNKCLGEARQMIFYLDSRNDQHHTKSNLSEEVGVAIIGLGLTLQGLQTYGIANNLWNAMRNEDNLSMMGAGWPTSRFVRKQLETAGLCPSEVLRLEQYLTSIGMLYCASIASFGRTSDHSRCPEDQCFADNIDENTYRTTHVEECRGCAHVGPNISDLASVLNGKSFPVIKLTVLGTSEIDIRISVQPQHKSTAYTAISHVWADGLGNPDGNTLPQCQILRLYKFLLSINRTRIGVLGRKIGIPAWMLSSSTTNTVYLWIDTLCIPVQKDLKNLRKKAISLMYDVYNEAEAVLVLDSSLLSVSTERPIEELCFRITTSPWMRRVWTFQEGALAKSLLVQFADKAIHAHTAMESIFRRIDGAEWIKTTLEESCSAILYNFMCGRRASPELLRSVLHDLSYRSTSKPEDKELCFAIMMRCDMRCIQNAEGDLRTKLVYQQLKFLPQGFLWHRGPTLDVSGFRWAPKDIFLANGGHPKDNVALSDRGLLVSAHGMVFFGRSHHMTYRFLYVVDFTTGKWYICRWHAEESFNGTAVESATAWTTLGIILGPDPPVIPGYKGVVIRLDWSPCVATPQELSNYICCCDTISGEYMGRVHFRELDSDDMLLLEEGKVLEVYEEAVRDRAEATRKGEDSLEKYPQWERVIIEIGDCFIFEGEMQGSEQKWCVT